MAELRIEATDVGLSSLRRAPIVVTLTDRDHNPVAGFHTVGEASKTLVQPVTLRASDSGTAVVELPPNAEVEPENTYYSVEVAGERFLIEKAADAETLRQALAADPDPLGTTALAAYAATTDAAITAAQDDATTALTDAAAAQATADAAIPLAQKAAADGVATLDTDGLLPAAQVPPAIERAHQGRQHTEPARGLAAGLADLLAGAGPLRVIVAGDSMVELGAGFGDVWEATQAILDGRPSGAWVGPSWVIWPAAVPDFAQDGTADTFGVDNYGRVLAAGDIVGSPTHQFYAGRFDVYYTARAAGDDLEVYVDGVLAATIDTSRDEDGAAVADDTPSQRVEVAVASPGPHTFYVEVPGAATGTVYYEGALAAPDGGLEVIGLGRSGVSSEQMVTWGGTVAHVAAMTARGQEPALVLIYADTAEVASDADLADAMAAVTTLVGQLRSAAPNATIAHGIPNGHGASASPAQFAAWAEEWRSLHDTLGLLTLDFEAAIGHVGAAYDPRGLSDDGVHYSAKGQVVADAVVADALLSRTVRAPALAGLTGVDFDDPTDLTDGTIPQMVAGVLSAEEDVSPVAYDDGSSTWLLMRAAAADGVLGGAARLGFAYNLLFGLMVRYTVAGVDQGLAPIGVATPTQDAHAATKNYVDTAVTGLVAGDGITDIVALTQAAYDALGTPDATTLYVITP